MPQSPQSVGKLPEHGDVIIRSLGVRETSPVGMGTLEAAETFGANRAEWIYGVDLPFIREAREAGVLVGTTMNYNGQPEVEEVPGYLEKFTSRDLHGRPVTRYNFRKFKDWQTEHFSPDVNIPAWLDFYTQYVAELYELPVSVIMRDDHAANAGLIVDGGTFTDESIAMFQDYLQTQVSPEELERLGVDDPAQFDIRPYLIERGAPEPGKEWLRWDGGPILRHYARAQRQAVARFFKEVRRRVEDQTGRRIPWSCNHTGQWGPIEEAFDYALGEFYTHQMQMETLVEIARRAEQIGKMQGLQGVLDGGWEKRDRQELVDEMRRCFATAYALGMLPMVPWDMYMPGRAKRFFGRVSEFGDLFPWVRENETLFDDYETAFVTAFDPVSSKQVWRHNQQIIRTPRIETPVLRINAPGILGVVRRKGQGTDARHVIHLVDWNQERRPFEVTLDLAALCGTSAARVVLLSPGAAPRTLSEGTDCTFALPALNPWGILVLEPLEAPANTSQPPVLLEPLGPVVPAGTRLALEAPGTIEVREVAPRASDWLPYRETMSIEGDCILEARSRVEPGDSGSPVARWHFWTCAPSRVDQAPEGDWQSLMEEFAAHIGSGKAAVGQFPDGAPLRYNSQDFAEAIGSIGEIEMSADLPEDAAFFRLDYAVADDAEVLRPSFRIEVHTGNRLLFETPIYNSVKGVVYGQEPGRREFVVALPTDARQLRVSLHRTGWFDDHNRVIWADLSVLAGEEYLRPERHPEPAQQPEADAAPQGAGGDGTQPFEWTGNEQ